MFQGVMQEGEPPTVCEDVCYSWIPLEARPAAATFGNLWHTYDMIYWRAVNILIIFIRHAKPLTTCEDDCGLSSWSSCNTLISSFESSDEDEGDYDGGIGWKRMNRHIQRYKINQKLLFYSQFGVSSFLRYNIQFIT